MESLRGTKWIPAESQVETVAIATHSGRLIMTDPTATAPKRRWICVSLSGLQLLPRPTDRRSLSTNNRRIISKRPVSVRVGLFLCVARARDGWMRMVVFHSLPDLLYRPISHLLQCNLHPGFPTAIC